MNQVFAQIKCGISHNKRLLADVGISILIVLFFHFFYFNGKISEKYVVYTSKIDEIKSITLNESLKFTIKKPFDELYLPIVAINIQELDIKIEVEGFDRQEVILKINKNNCQYDLSNDNNFRKIFDEYMQYFLIEELTLSREEIPQNCILTFSWKNDDGFLLIGTYRDQISYQTVKYTKINYLIYLFVLVTIIIGTIIVHMAINKNLDIEKIYTIIVIFLGSIYFVLFPPSCTNDSLAHIMSIYNRVSDFVGHSDWLNIDGDSRYSFYQSGDGYVIREVLRDSERNTANPNTKMYDEEFYIALMKIPNDETIKSGVQTDLYSYNNIVYLPYYLIMILGRVLNINLMIILHLAKLLGFVCYFFMIKISIKLIPYGKEALAFFSLTPMIMQSMVSISYDLFCIGGSFIAFSYVLKISMGHYKYTWKDTILMSFIIIAIGSVKYGIYFACFIFLLFFLIVYPKIKNNFKYLLYMFILIVLVVGLVFFKIDDIKNLVITNQDNYYSISDLIEDPIGTIQYIVMSIVFDIDKIIQGIFGGRLGWDEIVIPWFVIIAFIIFFIIACCCEKGRYLAEQKKYSILTVILFTLGIYIIFLRTTELDRKSIYGLQGRYFVPLVPLVICFMNNSKFKVNCKSNLIFSALWFMSVIHICFVMTIYLRR